MRNSPRWTWLRLCLFFLIGGAAPACQHREPTQVSPILNPQITVVETPPKPLPTDLIVQQAPPIPPPSQLAQQESLPTVETRIPSVQHQPVMPSNNITPVNYEPKRQGLQAALQDYLDHRNEDAIAALKHYPTDDQDIALVTMPLLARIDQGESFASMNGTQKLAILESLRSLVKRLSKSAPLVLQHVTLAKDQPLRYGEVIPRQNSNYYAGEYVYVYAEILNLIDFPNGEGLYNIRLDVTLELISAENKVVWNDSKAFKKAGSISSRNDYHVAARFDLLRQLPPGNYTVSITVLDRDTNRTAKQTMPLQILESKVAKR